jgi:prepilin-type N-terminal cleavage/methylation domain-containing protein
MFIKKLKEKKGLPSTTFLQKSGAGFTLIELLIVIAIIAIIASVAFVALDPLTRFRDARDSSRWSDIAAVMTAIKVDQVDNGGAYITALSGLTEGNVSMIGTDSSGCTGYDANCDTNVDEASCVDFAGLVNEGYLGDVPVSPNGAGTWTAGHTGYTVMVSSTGAVFIRACESENSDEIQVVR